MQEFNDLRKNARLVAGTTCPSPSWGQLVPTAVAHRSAKSAFPPCPPVIPPDRKPPIAKSDSHHFNHHTPITTHHHATRSPAPFRCLASLPPRHRPHHRRRHVPAQGGVTPARAAMPASAPPGSVPESCFSQAFSGTPSRAQVFLKSSPGRRPEPGFFPSRLRDAVPGPYVFQVTPGTASGARLGPHEVTAFLWKSTT